MSLSEITKSKEAELRQIKDHEVAVVFDAFGDIMVEEHGGNSSVDLGPCVDRIRQVGKATLVHNHPLGWQYAADEPRRSGSSFSPKDIAAACYAELTETRAVGPQDRYSMRPDSGLRWNGGYWINTMSPALERHKLAFQAASRSRSGLGRMITASRFPAITVSNLPLP